MIFFIAILPNLKESFNVMFAKRIKSLKVQRLLYTVPFKGKLTVPRNLILETWFSILENFEDRGLSQVSRCSRPFENLARPFEDLSSWVLRLSSGKNKGIFARLTFDTAESYGKHILALPTDLFWVQVHDISRRICLSENSLRSFSLFNPFYRNLSWMSFTK